MFLPESHAAEFDLMTEPELHGSALPTSHLSVVLVVQQHSEGRQVYSV